MTRATRAPAGAALALAAAALLTSGCTPVGFGGGLTRSPAPTPSPSVTGPVSAVSGGARTCAGGTAPCTRSGALRWSLPLTGPYLTARGDGGSTGTASVAVNGDGDPPAVAVADGVAVLATGDRVLGVDLDRGRVRWQRHDRDWSNRRATAYHGRVVVEQERATDGAGRDKILDARTGRGVTVTERDAEEVVAEPGRRGLLLVGAGSFDEKGGRREIRLVDLATGRTRWQVRVGRGYRYDVEDGVLYADDYRNRPGSGGDGTDDKGGYGSHRIFRVDLVHGRRLPDVAVPAALRDGYSLLRVTGRAIVLTGSAADGKEPTAFTTAGRLLVDPPPAGDEPSGQGPAVRVAGDRNDGGGLQYLRGAGWTGPAVRAVATGTARRYGTDPEVALAVACAPDGVRAARLTDPQPGVLCTAPRFFAVTW